MTRSGPDDAPRKGMSEARAIEGLLAYAQKRPRWGNAAIDCLSEAIARSRALARECPGEHTELLARCLGTAAKVLLKRRRATEALPLAEEAVTLTRAGGGAPLVVSLQRLAAVLEALHRYSDAAATMAEADKVTPPPES
ncbi:hypothetical protein ETD86_40655 [Nonomuraea turkmeniaca]|uniref:Tetratricopeptide repeat protein n=1 Tax=Nonomuraea turkmeniaca TaxID=103838 RepID=A0A5S4F221_9ACTN|nr:hypothetical protein [Nonomuraea turkmeniaca]TMR10149.1 hypothetical protein ETD86_40655 [Nonomuraea turkmeniaca]